MSNPTCSIPGCDNPGVHNRIYKASDDTDGVPVRLCEKCGGPKSTPKHGVGPLGPEMAKLVDSITSRPEPTPEETQALDRAEEKRRRDERRRDCLSHLARSLPKRYRDTTLDSYQVDKTIPEQLNVIRRLLAFRDELPSYIKAGRGLILTGTCGSGKDHLATWMLKEAAGLGVQCRYVDATLMCLEIAAAVKREEAPERVIQKYATDRVLLLSDPDALGRGGTEANRRALLALVKWRNNEVLCTWATLNVKDVKEARAVLGPPVWDRLRQDALILELNWESYR